MRSCFLAVAMFVGACGGQSEQTLIEGDDLEAAVDDQALTAELKATAGNLTVWFNPVLQSRLVNNEVRWVASGRANRNLSGVFSFVPDDAYGSATLTGPRTFEVSFASGSELNTILSDLRILVALTPVGSTQAVTAGVRFAPRFTSMSGSTRLTLTQAVSPVYANGGLTYRGRARATLPTATVSASTLDDATIRLGRRSTAGEWNVDFAFDDLALALSVPGVNSEKVEFVVNEAGRPRNKLAVLVATVSAVELTTQDPYQVWPPVRCTTEARACLNAKPIGTTDFGDCGSYRLVDACGLPNQIPGLYPSPDDFRVMDVALAQVRATLPAGKTVEVVGYGVNGRNATVELVGRAWMDQSGVENPTVVGTLTPGRLNTFLDGWNARSLVPAAQAVEFQKSFKALRIDSQRTMGATVERRSHVLLFFSTAARVIVITLQ